MLQVTAAGKMESRLPLDIVKGVCLKKSIMGFSHPLAFFYECSNPGVGSSMSMVISVVGHGRHFDGFNQLS